MSCNICNKNKCECVKKISTRGPKGEKGDRGPTGPKGDKGDTGAAGSNGTSGANGTNGVDGTAIYSTYNSQTGTTSSTTASASTTLSSILIMANKLAVDGDELEINYYGKYDNNIGNGIESNIKIKHSEANILLAQRNGADYSPATEGVFSIKVIVTRLSATLALITADFFVTSSNPAGDFSGSLNNRYMSIAEVAATFDFTSTNTIDFVITNDAGIGEKLSYTLQKATSEMKKKQ